MTTGEQRPRTTPAATTQFIWLELIKGLAFAWIFANHAAERIFGYPYIANPGSDWVPLAARIAQMRPLHGHGVWDIPINLARWVGWAGDQGVNLFLIASGFGLTWGLLCRQGTAPLALRRFYAARATRIYPLWWAAHLAVLVGSIVVGRARLATDVSFYLSAAGIRVTPELLYYLVPAWWYIGLLLQLYLVYPLLWDGLRRHGPMWLLLVAGVGSCVVRGIGLLTLSSGIDAWSRGAIFITRLPEFVVGMCLAAWLHQAPERVYAWLRHPATLLVAVVAYILGTVAALSFIGMTIAPVLLGSSAFVVLYACLHAASARPTTQPWLWMGRHSYALFLVHHPFILALVPNGMTSATAARILLGVLAAAVCTVVGTVVLEWTVTLPGWLWRHRRSTVLRPITIGGLALFAVLLGVESLIRSRDPQEILGWGERPSLETDAAFGWRLRPAQRTRLRWESYDYEVTANRLGFPGPDRAAEKPASGFRIMTTGDAFTSAEGVDTDQAWPRLLETTLAARLPQRTVEVLNFAITGYGPNQYAAVIDRFAPLYRPDLIIVGLFVNDFEDVLTSDDEFRASIGFQFGPQDSWWSMLRLLHLRQWLKLHPAQWAYERLRGQPAPHGYFLGQFAALERDRPEITTTGAGRVRDRLAAVVRDATAVGAGVLIVMIPAPAQICDANALDYYPNHVDLTDTTRFDLDLPQRLTQQIANDLQVTALDLRPLLRAAPSGCPYQSRNLHWTAGGHQLVAHYLADELLSRWRLP